MGINVGTLEKAMVGLVVIFALITFFGTIADNLALAIGNVTSSDLDGVAVFGIVGLLVTLGILISVMRGVMGKR